MTTQLDFRSRLARRRGGMLVGCLAVLAVVLILLIIGGVWVAMSWKGWAAGMMQQGTAAAVAGSGLSQDQKDKIIADVNRLADDFKAGTITTEQMTRVMKEIVESPLIPLAGVQATQLKYVEPSDMTPEEKTHATHQLQRFARGVHERKIPQEAIDDVVKPIATLKTDGRWEFKANPSRDELDQFIANVKRRTDEAGIPDEPYDLNIADELKKAIDKALGRT